MTGPSWLADAFAVIMIATAVYCASRLVAARWWRRTTDRDVDTAHVFMGVAMAGMLVPRLNPFASGGWAALFGIISAWFGWQIVRAYRGADLRGHRPGHHVPHLLASGAMIYMLLAGSAAGSRGVSPGTAISGAAGGSAHLPTLALVIVVALLGYVILTTDRLASLERVRAAAPAAPAVPPAWAAATPAPAQPVGPGTVTGLSDTGRGPTGQPADSGGAGTAAGPDPGSGVGAGPGPGAARPMSPRLAACCEIAMGIIMGYVLILML
jgi:hypothetical protein